MNESQKKFRVAFSFAGTRREFVGKVARILAQRFGEPAILYDEFHRAEFGQHRMGFILPSLYHNDTELIVVVFCHDYEKKEWCGLEWDAIFDLLKQGKGRMVMLCRFDQVLPKGLHSTDIFIELDDESPESAASLVLQRLAILEGKDRDFYITRPTAKQDSVSTRLATTRFQPLSTLLDKFSAFSAFPKAELFENDLTFFLPEELNLITELEAALAGPSDKRLSLLMGKPATGKTVIACTVAKRLERAGYHVNYLSLTPSLTFDDVWQEITSSNDEKPLFILDDCHLNADVASGVVRNFDDISTSASCLLVSRTVDAPTRSSPDYLSLDYVAALEAGERCFSLDELLENGVDQKILGIIAKRKEWLERVGRAKLSIGDKRRMPASVHRNLFLLEAVLSFWPEDKPLSSLSHPEILTRVRDRYFRPFTESERECLLQLAALGQFETRGVIPPGAEEPYKKLRRHGCCTIEPTTNFVELPHSEFGKLLLEAHAATPEFTSSYRGVDQFTVMQLEQYITAFQRYPINLDELLLNLFEHKAQYAYVPLLKSKPIQNRIFAYYRESRSIDGLVNFLFKAKNYLTRGQLSIYVNELVLSNRDLKALILNAENPVLRFVKLLKTAAHKGGRDDFDGLWNQFSAGDRSAMLRSSNFYVACYSIHSLNEANQAAAHDLVGLLDMSELVKSAQAATLSQLLEGLKHLRRVDGRKAKTVLQLLARIDELGISRQLGGVDFEEVARSITDLNRIDSVATQIIFSRVPDDFWKSLMRGCSLKSLAHGLSLIKDASFEGALRLTRLLDDNFLRGLTKTWRLSHLGNGLAELNKVHPRLAVSLVNAIDTNDLVEIANRAALVYIGKGLSELSKVNRRKAASVLRALDRKRLITQLEGAPIETISKALSEFHNIDRWVATGIYESIDLPRLGGLVSAAPVEAIGRILRELYKVQPRRTEALIEMIDFAELGKHLQEVSVVQVGHILSELNQVDRKQAQALYRLLPAPFLVQKARRESLGFQRLGTLIQQLVKVDTAERKTQTLLQQLGIDDLVRRARQGRFEEISSGLQDIASCDMGMARAILDHLDFRLLEGSARLEQFDKLCHGLKRLALIDPAKADSLARRFPPQELAASASHLRMDLLASSLSDLADVNSEIARSVLNSISFEIIVKRLETLSPVLAKQALVRFEKVDRAAVRQLRQLLPANTFGRRGHYSN